MTISSRCVSPYFLIEFCKKDKSNWTKLIPDIWISCILSQILIFGYITADFQIYRWNLNTILIFECFHSWNQLQCQNYVIFSITETDTALFVRKVAKVEVDMLIMANYVDG